MFTPLIKTNEEFNLNILCAFVYFLINFRKLKISSNIRNNIDRSMKLHKYIITEYCYFRKNKNERLFKYVHNIPNITIIYSNPLLTLLKYYHNNACYSIVYNKFNIQDNTY